MICTIVLKWVGEGEQKYHKPRWVTPKTDLCLSAVIKGLNPPPRDLQALWEYMQNSWKQGGAIPFTSIEKCYLYTCKSGPTMGKIGFCGQRTRVGAELEMQKLLGYYDTRRFFKKKIEGGGLKKQVIPHITVLQWLLLCATVYFQQLIVTVLMYPSSSNANTAS